MKACMIRLCMAMTSECSGSYGNRGRQVARQVDFCRAYGYSMCLMSVSEETTGA